MKIVHKKFKVTNLITRGIKIIGYSKKRWYECRSKNGAAYKVNSKCSYNNILKNKYE